MHFREMKLEDLPAIAKINVDTFRATHAGFLSESFLNSLSYSQSEKRLARMLADPGKESFIYVAENGGKVLGYVMAGAARKEIKGFVGELYGMYILPEFHRMGIGRSLMKKAAAHFLQREIRSVFVEVFKKNQPARRFYERLGGEEICEYAIGLGRELADVVAYGWMDIQRWIRE